MKKTKIFIASLMVTTPLLISSQHTIQANQSESNINEESKDIQNMNGEEIFNYYESENTMEYSQSNDSLDENIIQPYVIDPGDGSTGLSPLAGHYLYNQSNNYISTQAQNRQTAIQDIATGIAGLSLGVTGYGTASAVISALSLNNAVDMLITGEAYGTTTPLLVREYTFLANEPTATYGGYVIVEVYNSNTGSYIRSERHNIQNGI